MPVITNFPAAARGGPAAAALMLLLSASLLPPLPVRAGSVTAESVWNSNDARQRAMEQLPKGATVTSSRCQDFEVGGLNSRYRCTLNYSPASPDNPTGPAAGP